MGRLPRTVRVPQPWADFRGACLRLSIAGESLHSFGRRVNATAARMQTNAARWFQRMRSPSYATAKPSPSTSAQTQENRCVCQAMRRFQIWFGSQSIAQRNSARREVARSRSAVGATSL